ncbi:MAG: tRNA (cmo5U34)-methyltransferase [Alphaproteobacteria bacterium]|jgi:tRNA (cmo5U34)-methyltransferase
MKKSKKTSSQDTIYAAQQGAVGKFSFNQQVVDVFPDMINRSVPSYQNIIEGIGKIANLLCSSSPVIYDLGCSLGNVSLSIAKHALSKQPKIMGIDNSLAMIERCQQHIDAFSFGNSISLQQGDLVKITLEPCNMAVVNFTLQFIESAQRQGIINNIYNALAPNGIFVLSEKIKSVENDLDCVLIDLHHDFKRENGYSDLEISQKRSALEDVMKLDTIETHSERLRQAGFSKMCVWYQHFNFVSILAIK